MPLLPGKSKDTLAANIAELHRANASKPQNKKRSAMQIAAIAFAKRRESK